MPNKTCKVKTFNEYATEGTPQKEPPPRHPGSVPVSNPSSSTGSASRPAMMVMVDKPSSDKPSTSHQSQVQSWLVVAKRCEGVTTGNASTILDRWSSGVRLGQMGPTLAATVSQ